MKETTRIGRPALSASSPSASVSFYLPEDLLDDIDSYADRDSQNRSEKIRELVEIGLHVIGIRTLDDDE